MPLDLQQQAKRRRTLARWLRRAWPALAFLAFPLLLYASVTLGGRSMIPFDALRTDPLYREALAQAGVTSTQNDLVADLVFQNLVWKQFLVDALQQGDVPLWNPYLAGGMPFLAAGQHSALYPLTLVNLLVAPALAAGWVALLSLWLAAAAMYVLGRTLGLGRMPSVSMGLAWSLAPLFVVNSVFPMIQAGMTWLPILIAAILVLTRAEAEQRSDRAAKHIALEVADASDDPRPAPAPREWLPKGQQMVWLLALSTATALTALAGHPEMLIYSALAAGAFSLYRLLALWRRGGALEALRISFWLLGAAAAGALVSAIQLIPLVELLQANWRSGAAPYETLVQNAFGIRQVITFLVPDFFGNPAHHAVSGVAGVGGGALADHAMWGTAWGTRNYVEAAAYAGIPVLLLAPIGLFHRRHRGLALFFLAAAGLALSFIFGLPTYRLLFELVPGIDQLRTPFRWIYVFNFSLVVLAGLGLDALLAGSDGEAKGRFEEGHRVGSRVDRPKGSSAALAIRSSRLPGPLDRLLNVEASRLGLVIGATATAGGALTGLMLLLAWLRPERWAVLVRTFFETLPCTDGYCALDAALQHFPSLESLAAYQYWNLAHLAIFAALSGVAMVFIARGRLEGRWLLGLALALDLFTVGFGFNPAVDAELAQLQPPAVEALSGLVEAKWGRATGLGEKRVLWPNTAMREGIPDIRAYDSILPEWTIESLSAVEDQSGMLRYNRIANLSQPQRAAHPLIRALGVRYLVSSDRVEAEGLEQVYGDGSTYIYENRAALRRAWVVNTVEVIEDREALLGTLANFDPETTVLLEELPAAETWTQMESGRDLASSTSVQRDTERLGEMEIDVYGAPTGGMLVVSEAWFPGWRAWVEVAGEAGRVETEVPVYRANGMLRAVPVPPGRSSVRLKYFPMSVKLGLYFSFLGGILLFLALAYALWRRFVKVDEADELGTIAVNSAGPILSNLLNKVVLFAFAMLATRLLGPDHYGQYYVAMTIIGFADILSNFGLNILATREVSRDRSLAPRYLTQQIVLRLMLWVLTVPLLGAYIAWRTRPSLAETLSNPLSREVILAIALLAVALIPSNLNAAISSIFQAYERMVLPAAVSIVSTLVTVSLGALALLAGYGFVSLAAVAIVTNVVTFFILSTLAWRQGIRPELSLRPSFIQWMFIVSLPLMLNHLLQTVFFKVDVLLLNELLPRDGNTVVGWYQAAYKWVDALIIIQAAFIMAIFPMMSRRAEADRGGLARAFGMAQRWLISIALPIAVVTTYAADTLVWILAGADYVPQGGTALKVMIWFLPFSFANGLTQYVLIAMDRQRLITLSFVVAVTFNLVANWLVIPGREVLGLSIPAYSYVGAAVVTILSELVLRIPFGYGLRDLGAPPLLVLLWRPALAAAAAAGFLVFADQSQLAVVPGALGALLVYGLVLRWMGGITEDDKAILRRLRPGGRSGKPESTG